MTKPAALLMEELGFDCLGPDPARTPTTLWLKSYGARDLLVVIADDATADDAVEAIYDAGTRDARDHLREKWNGFMASLKPAPEIVTDWPAARELQKRLHEKLTAATSMPHPLTHHG